MRKFAIKILMIVVLSWVLGLGSLFFMVGCESKGHREPDYGDLNRASVVRFDGCEYIQFLVHGGYAWTHKGNCDNHGAKD